jgi:catechol-2,3-dioxygenase
VSAAALDAIPVIRISELVLESADLERSLGFYRAVLGFTVYRQSGDRAWLLAGPRTRLGLWAPALGPGIANGRGGSHVHFAFHVDESQLDSIVARLEDHGLDVEVHDFQDESRGRAAYVSDPDGNVVEFWTLDVSFETEVGG